LNYQEFNQRYPINHVHIEPVSSISPKEGTGLMPSFEPWYKEVLRERKMRRIFLSGMLLGVMIAATFTFVFAIPGNSNYWRTEIWKRGGAAWTADKNGHIGWRWMVEPIPDAPPKKPVIVPASQTKSRIEQL
jgi:hypothetical protein